MNHKNIEQELKDKVNAIRQAYSKRILKGMQEDMSDEIWLKTELKMTNRSYRTILIFCAISFLTFCGLSMMEIYSGTKTTSTSILLPISTLVLMALAQGHRLKIENLKTALYLWSLTQIKTEENE